MQHLSLRNRIITASIALMLLVALGVNLIYLLPFSSETRKLTDQLLQQTSRVNMGQVKAFLEQPLSEAELYAHVFSIVYQSISREECLEMMQEWLLLYPEYQGASAMWAPNAFDGRDEEFLEHPLYVNGAFATYLLRDGDTIIMEEEFETYMEEEYFAVAFETRQPHITEATEFEMSSGDLFTVISIATPIIVNNSVLGVVNVDYSLDTIVNLISGFSFLDAGYCTLFDESGNIIASGNPDLAGGNYLNFLVSSADKDTVRQILNSGEGSATLEHSPEGDEMMLSAIETFTIGSSDSVFALTSTVPRSVAMAAANRSSTVAISVSVAMLLVAFTALYFIIQRSVVIPFTRQILSLNRMTSELGKVNDELYDSSANLASGSTELSAAITECASIMKQLHDLAILNSQKISQGNAMAENSFRLTVSGAESTQQISRSLDELEQGSVEVQRVAKMIEDIAFQTNILALNAAVEAARAGDAGRGFAVVAEEVGALAGRSAIAAQQTAEILRRNIDLTRQNVGEGRAITLVLEEIRTHTASVSELLKQIDSATQEQQQSLQQTQLAIQQLEQGSYQSADESARSAELAQQLTDGSQSLNAVAAVIRQLVFGSGKSQENI